MKLSELFTYESNEFVDGTKNAFLSSIESAMDSGKYNTDVLYLLKDLINDNDYSIQSFMDNAKIKRD